MNDKDVLTRDTLLDLIGLVQKIYKSDGRPWVIGYSGGKDSSAVLQVVWVAISKLPEEERQKKIYVISSDTLVEAPAVVNRIAQSQEAINKAAKEQNLPFDAQMVTPQISDTFWANIIGRGYPTPYTNFRWCTDRLKIQPTTKFITDTVAQYGEVIILLGARKQESSSRAQVMENRNDLGNRLSRHNDMANAFVFTPIEDWSENDVWTYLMQSKNPWGSDNKELKTMYLNAQSGECPLVIDKSTPSCGGGRFGCWTCTVVSKDRSMEALIENGEDWMQPMLDFRNSLADIETWLKTRPNFKGIFIDHSNVLKNNDLSSFREIIKSHISKEEIKSLVPSILKGKDRQREIASLTKEAKKKYLESLDDQRKKEIIAANAVLDQRFVYRDVKRRNGRIELFINDDMDIKITWGPYKLDTKKEILRGLLEKQVEIREKVKDRDNIIDKKIDLISQDELHQIRKMWRFEEGDWEDSLPSIYKDVTTIDFEGLEDDTSGLGGAELKLLEEVCREYNLSERELMELFEVERRHQQMGRRIGIYNKLGTVLKKDWRTFDSNSEKEPQDANK